MNSHIRTCHMNVMRQRARVRVLPPVFRNRDGSLDASMANGHLRVMNIYIYNIKLFAIVAKCQRVSRSGGARKKCSPYSRNHKSVTGPHVVGVLLVARLVARLLFLTCFKTFRASITFSNYFPDWVKRTQSHVHRLHTCGGDEWMDFLGFHS